MNDFKWKHFRGEMTLGCVRWYCKYGISYRDLEEMMVERGVDETYVKVKEQWKYLYRAITKRGHSRCFESSRSCPG